MLGDPDDHRPNTTWALVVNSAPAKGEGLSRLTLLFEHIAPGDRTPLHTHTTEEVIVIDEGDAEAVVGDDRRVIGAGACVFVPAGTPHGTRNAGSGTLRLHAVFPASVPDITYLERNPAPGTIGDPPQPPATLDPRAG